MSLDIAQTPFTFIIIAITVLIHFRSKKDYSIVEKLKFYPYSIKRNPSEKSRFLTNGFVHGSDQHLFINMFVLYMFGTFIEGSFGSTYLFGPLTGRVLFVLLYLLSIIAASIPSYFKHQDNPAYAAVGASGATSALIMSYILFQPWNWFTFPPLPALILGVGYIIYSYYASKNKNDGIAHEAHLWGAIFGVVFTLGAISIFNPDRLISIAEGFKNWQSVLSGPF